MSSSAAVPTESTDFTAPSPSNTLGLVGFIVSIVGVLTCGLVSPLALLISVMGLFKAPRGFAIGGSVLGLAGSGGLVVVVVAAALLASVNYQVKNQMKGIEVEAIQEMEKSLERRLEEHYLQIPQGALDEMTEQFDLLPSRTLDDLSNESFEVPSVEINPAVGESRLEDINIPELPGPPLKPLDGPGAFKRDKP